MKKYLVVALGAAFAATTFASPASAHGLGLVGVKDILKNKLEDRGELKIDLENRLKTNASSTASSSKSQAGLHGSIVVKGEVTAVSTSSLSVSSKGQVWTINAADAKITNRNVTMANIAVGHDVIVIGRPVANSSTSLKAAIITDFSLHNDKSGKATSTATSTVKNKKSGISGIISDVNASAKTFVVTQKDGSKINIAMDSDTDLRLLAVNGSASTSASSTVSGSGIWSLLQNAKVQVKGVLDKTTNTIDAIKVFVRATINL